jgi:hypothetical protein
MHDCNDPSYALFNGLRICTFVCARLTIPFFEEERSTDQPTRVDGLATMT